MTLTRMPTPCSEFPAAARLSDVAADPGVKIVGVFPPETHPAIVYPIALTSENREPAAGRLLQFLTSTAATPIFEKHGFTVDVE
jgi:molybdate transport system substrate-binding protein